jgi:hypothetical protein
LKKPSKKYIGIDPDVDKSGFAIWDSKLKKFVHIHSYDLFDICQEIKDWDEDAEIMVYLEAGWLNKKANFHGFKNQSKIYGESIAKNVGRNHEIGRQIEKFCIKNEIEYKLIRPTKEKVKDIQLLKRLTGWEKVTNQDKRDAAMLVVGLP